MRIRSSLTIAPVALIAMTLVLSACASKPLDVSDETDAPIQQEVVDDSSSNDSANDPSTKGLSQEAIDQGFTVQEMPSGWPSELPLPDGIPVSAIRSGETFILLFDLAAVSEGEKIVAWYEASDWALTDDLETGGNRILSFASAESNDYGPLRRVTLGLGMNDWPTAFQYHLEVQE